VSGKTTDCHGMSDSTAIEAIDHLERPERPGERVLIATSCVDLLAEPE
jgi:hypothetical protein